MNHIGNRVKELRKLKGITQKQLADKLGITQAAIGQLEATENPKIETLIKISAALNVEITDITGSIKNSSDQEYKDQLITEFNKLNSSGKKQALDLVSLVGKIGEYIK